MQELKIKQSKLSRLYRLRQDTFNYLENKNIEVEFAQISDEINELVLQIRDLKTAIVKTNALTKVDVNGQEVSIQALILMISDLRSELSQYEDLKPKGPVYLGGQAVEYIPQRKQDEIAKTIADMEQKKADLDKILQGHNWSVDLIED